MIKKITQYILILCLLFLFSRCGNPKDETEPQNLYFYVTADKIYRVWTDTVQGDEIVYFCGDDALLTDILDTDEKLAENSEFVCQPEDVSAAPGEDESGLRHEIHRSDNRITYSGSDMHERGENFAV